MQGKAIRGRGGKAEREGLEAAWRPPGQQRSDPTPEVDRGPLPHRISASHHRPRTSPLGSTIAVILRYPGHTRAASLQQALRPLLLKHELRQLSIHACTAVEGGQQRMTAPLHNRTTTVVTTSLATTPTTSSRALHAQRERGCTRQAPEPRARLPAGAGGRPSRASLCSWRFEARPVADARRGQASTPMSGTCSCVSRSLSSPSSF